MNSEVPQVERKAMKELKNPISKIFLFALLFITSMIMAIQIPAGEIYKYVAPDGTVFYSDNPCDGCITIMKSGERTNEEKLRDEVYRLRVQGRNFLRMGNYLDAANTFKNVVPLCKKLKDNECLSVTYNDMGHAFMALGNRTQADRFFRLSADALAIPEDSSVKDSN